MINRSAYMQAYSERIVENSERNQLIATLIKEGRSRGYHVIVLLERLRHLKLVSQLIQDIPHRIVAGQDYQGEHQKWDHKKNKLVRVVEGKMIDVKTRQKITSKFEDSRVRVILANRVFKKGINIKRVDVIINGSASKSKDDAIQCFGRGVRLHPDKSGLLYFDIADQDLDNKRNWFARAARSRKKAFTQAGIVTQDFTWKGYKDEAEELYNKAEAVLRRELQK